MDREVSGVINISVTLAVLSLLILLILTTANIGLGVRNMAVGEIVRIESRLETGTLNSLSGRGSSIMPKAAIYLIVSKEFSGIASLDYGYIGFISPGVEAYITGRHIINSNGFWTLNGSNTALERFRHPENIISRNDLAGEVSVTVEENNLGLYDLVIRDVNH